MTKSDSPTSPKPRRKNVVSVQLSDEEIALAVVISGSAGQYVATAVSQYTAQMRAKIAAIERVSA
jgi:hypothetical protein